MENVTQELFSIFSQVFIPIIIVAVSSLITAYITKYSKRQDKNQYVKFLRENFLIIESYLNAIQEYKAIRIETVPFILTVGLIVGFNGENDISFLYYMFLHYKYFSYSDFLPFELSMAPYLCGYVFSLSLLFFIWKQWYVYLESRYMVTPKLTVPDTAPPKIMEIPKITLSSLIVYLSYWLFIGIYIGVSIAMFVDTIRVMIKYEVIPLPFSFSWATFQEIYTTLTNYPHFDGMFTFYFSGFVVSLGLFVYSYQVITESSNEVKRKIRDFFRYSFPEVKITTENSEVKGQLTSILSKNLVIISERDMIKMIPWDKIETMEASRKDSKNG